MKILQGRPPARDFLEGMMLDMGAQNTLYARLTPQEIGILKKAHAILDKLHDAQMDLTTNECCADGMDSRIHEAEVALGEILEAIRNDSVLIMEDDPIYLPDSLNLEGKP